MAKTQISSSEFWSRRKKSFLIGFGTLLTALIILGVLFLNGDTSEDTQLAFVSDSLNLNIDAPADLAIESSFEMVDLQFESSDSSVLTVEQGVVIMYKPGQAVVTVQTLNGNFVDSIVLVVHSGPTSDNDLDANSEQDVDSEIPEDDKSKVVDPVDSDSEPDPEVHVDLDPEPEPEVPVEIEPDPEPDPEPKASLIHTITIVNEAFVTLSSIRVTDGALLEGLLPTNDSALFRGYYLENTICDDPFDQTTVITGSFILIEGLLNYTSPCVELDELAFDGSFQVGETITAYVSPSSATVTYAWFISEDNRDFFPLPLLTRAAIEITPEMFRQYLAVNIEGTGDYEGLLKRGSERIGLNSQTIRSGDDSSLIVIDQDSINNLLSQDYIPVGSLADLQAIGSTDSHEFASGTNLAFVTSGGLTKNYAVIRDIDLSAYNGETSVINGYFEGTLDGLGFTISGVSIDSPYNSPVALFESLKGATITNVTLSNFNIAGGSNLAILAGTNYQNTLISGVSITNSKVSSTNQYVGGFVGENTSGSELTLNQVSFDGDILGLGHVGGLVGSNQSSAKVELSEVTNQGNIKGLLNVGGLIGQSKGTLTMTNAMNSGDITSFTDGTDSWVGGIVGYILAPTLNSTMSGVTNSGNVSGTGVGVGGLIGKLNAILSIDSVTNSGVVIGNDDDVGGLIGNSVGQLNITNAKNLGNVTGDYNTAGIIGDADIGSSINMENVINIGNVEGHVAVGGVIGHTFNSSITMTSIMNIGNVDGSGALENGVGGIIGYIQGDASHIVSLSNASNHGSVDNGDNAGGIIGFIIDYKVDVNNVYNAGIITTRFEPVGGIIGEIISADVTVTNSFYLTGTAIDDIGNGTALESPALSIAQMTVLSTFENAGWDIAEHPTHTAIWSIGYNGKETYPWLTFNGYPGLIVDKP